MFGCPHTFAFVVYVVLYLELKYIRNWNENWNVKLLEKCCILYLPTIMTLVVAFKLFPSYCTLQIQFPLWMPETFSTVRLWLFPVDCPRYILLSGPSQRTVERTRLNPSLSISQDRVRLSPDSSSGGVDIFTASERKGRKYVQQHYSHTVSNPATVNMCPSNGFQNASQGINYFYKVYSI